MVTPRTERGRPRGPSVERKVRWLTILTTVTANTIGGVIVFVLLVWVLPKPATSAGPSVALVLAMTGGYMGISIPLFTTWSLRMTRRGRLWLHEGRAPTPEEQRALLRSPLHVLFGVATAWAGAALVFGTFSIVTTGVEFGVTVAITVMLGGLTTSVIGYLLAERVLRPAASVALAAAPLDRPALPGVTYRILVAWAVGSGIPSLGIFLASLSTLTQRDFTQTQLAVFGLTLAVISLAVGFLSIMVAARVTAAPINAVRRAMRQLESGDLSARVAVHDGTEVGMLQSGFNRMAEGLEERERIRAVFGQHVGVDVARHALDEAGTNLGGQQRKAAALFVDVIASTELAANVPADVVVSLLNTFFGVVVEVAHEHGGWVNKFQGDGALVVFGAPGEEADAATRALAAARHLAARLMADAPRTPAAIGVSYGAVVAGNVGSDERLEYTVIGDPVNEAARLTEVAKSVPNRVAASSSTLDAAAPDEVTHWRLGEAVVLRGRAEPTVLAHPA